jgi:uncharacterized alkaline shock family protein YloU
MSAEEKDKLEEQVEETPEDQEEATAEIGAEIDEEDVESEDSLTFSNGVIEKIVALGLRDVPGVVGMKGGFINRVQDAFGVRDARRGVTVEVTPDSAVRVNLSVFISYGSYAPQVFENVKQAVIDAVTGMTGLEVAGVNLRIEDVLTPEEIAARQPKLPEADEQEALPEGVFDELLAEADIVPEVETEEGDEE